MDKIIDLGRLAATATEGQAVFDLQALAFGEDRALRFGHVLAEGMGSRRLEATVTLILRSGHLVLEGAGAEVTLSAGDSALIGKGTALAWAAKAADMVMVCDFDAEPRNLVARHDHGAALGPGGAPNPALLRSAAPECGTFGYFAEGALSSGLWQATAYDRQPVTYVYSECMYLLSGSVTLYDDAGGQARFAAGDVFIILTGATAGWRSTETLRKVYLISQRA